MGAYHDNLSIVSTILDVGVYDNKARSLNAFASPSSLPNLKSYPFLSSQCYVDFPREPHAVILSRLPRDLQRRLEGL